MHLWIDSKFVADGLAVILRHGFAGDWSHMDLWERVQTLLSQLGQNDLVPHWIPSHLDPALLSCPFEEWVSHWNNKVDAAVGHYNLQRPADFLRLRAAAIAHHEQGAVRLRMLRAFYFAVAAQSSSAEIEPPESPDVSLFGFVPEPQSSIGDLYIQDLQNLISGSEHRPPDLPAQFLFDLITLLFSNCDGGSGVYPVCFEKLSLWLVRDFSILLPFRNPATGNVDLQSISSRYERPTLAFVVRIIRRSLVWFLTKCVDFGDALFTGFDKVDLKVYRPADGIYVRLACHHVSRCQQLLGDFTRARPIRRACDVAKPV
eukprot:s259_g34.t1